MRRLWAIAMVAALALPAALVAPAFGQRAGAHGGFSGHSVAAPRSFSPPAGGFAHGPTGVRPAPTMPRAFSPSMPRAFSPAHPIGLRPPPGPRIFNYAPNAIAPRMGTHSIQPRMGSHPILNRPEPRMPYTRLGADHGHGPWNGHDHDHDHHHRGVYWGGYVYPWYPYYGYSPWYYTGPIFTGYVDPWLFTPDDDWYGYGNTGYVAAPYRDYGMQSQSSQPYPQEYYDSDSAAAGQAFGRESYAGQTQVIGAGAAPAPTGSLTVVFNDGRPPEQIHNYLLTADSLTVLDSHYRQIPMAQIDVAATQQANRAAGVDFRVPVKQ